MILKRLLDLAYGDATVGVKLAFKKNILIAYMPREGYNFKDVVLIGARLVYKDTYNSHREKIITYFLCLECYNCI